MRTGRSIRPGACFTLEVDGMDWAMLHTLWHEDEVEAQEVVVVALVVVAKREVVAVPDAVLVAVAIGQQVQSGGAASVM